MIFPLRQAVRPAAQGVVVQIAAVVISFTAEILVSSGGPRFLVKGRSIV